MCLVSQAFHAAHGVESFVDPEGEELASLLSISRGISFMLLFIYGSVFFSPFNSMCIRC
jgi:hypothetical protein